MCRNSMQDHIYVHTYEDCWRIFVPLYIRETLDVAKGPSRPHFFNSCKHRRNIPVCSGRKKLENIVSAIAIVGELGHFMVKRLWGV